MEPIKDNGENIGQSATVEEMHQTTSRGGVPLMRSQEDDLSVWQTVRRYKLVGIIAMSAAFSASLDGYRKRLPLITLVLCG
jgi:SP family general alpha glucoside:H+ symporter-like MFS transporter